MNLKLPGNGDTQTAIVTILGTLAVLFIPQLDPLKEHLHEILFVIIGALFTSAFRSKS